MAVAPFDQPYLSVLLGDREIAALFEPESEIAAMLAFEAALAEAQAEVGLIPAAAATAIVKACESFAPNMEALAQATARDGVVVPGLVAQLRAAVGAEFAAYVHVGATSQDVVDTSLVARLSPISGILERRLAVLCTKLAVLSAHEGGREVMGRTRMQRAKPIPLVHRLDNWRAPLVQARIDLAKMLKRLMVLQLGSAVGTRAELGPEAQAIVAGVASRLGLTAGPVWHNRRGSLVHFADLLSIISGSLGKIGQDVVLLAQNEVAEVTLASTGGSSAMPHKANPVAAEVLVTLARFNATLVGGMHQALVHEFERSGAAWTLEWLLLPQMVVATGCGLLHATAMIEGMKFVSGGVGAE